MLVLFDIDGTMLTSEGAGLVAMLDAMHELVPGRTFSFDGIPVAGRLDTLIWRDLLARHEMDHDEALHGKFRERYGHHLGRRLGVTHMPRALPGVNALIGALAQEPSVTLGILTGNYEHTGRLKVERAGIPTQHFAANAWADDGASRRALTPVAMQRCAHRRGRPLAPGDVVVIGDTPHDIDCAHAHGCRALAVATGGSSADELRSHHADLVVDDLSDSQALARWILGR
jgi:phosphoglycolate phosphatase-like HAD superfamily hydrolase